MPADTDTATAQLEHQQTLGTAAPTAEEAWPDSLTPATAETVTPIYDKVVKLEIFLLRIGQLPQRTWRRLDPGGYGFVGVARGVDGVIVL